MKTLLSLLAIFLICAFIYETPERCEHVAVDAGAVGITKTYVTMCLTEQVQVDNHGEHFQSKRSEEYFK